MHAQIAETRPFLLLLLFGPENKASHREKRGEEMRRKENREREREQERGSSIRKKKRNTVMQREERRVRQGGLEKDV